MKRFLCVRMFGLVLLPVHVQAEPATESFTTTASGLQFAITAHGSGPAPEPGNVVLAHYTGTLPDGTVFDSSRTRGQPFAFTVSRPAQADGTGEIKKQVILGWDEGFRLLHVGDKAVFVIPPQLAYGQTERGKIPANSTLRFEVELLEIKQRALADVLNDTINSAGIDGARKKYTELKSNRDFYVSESQFNALGYRLLGQNKLAEARTVLEWNVELFPNSGNVYDSLGEAILKAGDKVEARRLYEKSLELDPKNENAKKVLTEMSTPAAP